MKHFLLTTIALACSMMVFAGPKDKKKAAADDDMKKGTGTVYVFGFSHQLADSTVYITDIQRVDSIDLAKKTQFLPFRSEFSLQLKEYLEGKKRLVKQTSCVYFNANEKKLQKVRAKIRKRYIETKGMTLVLVRDDEFTFKHPIDIFNTADEVEK